MREILRVEVIFGYEVHAESYGLHFDLGHGEYIIERAQQCGTSSSAQESLSRHLYYLTFACVNVTKDESLRLFQLWEMPDGLCTLSKHILHATLGTPCMVHIHGTSHSTIAWLPQMREVHRRNHTRNMPVL